jgi:hypothetical protein
MPVEAIEAPYLGMNTEALANAIPKGQCQSSQNLLPGFPGRAPIRGPLTTHSDFSLPAIREVVSIWSHPAYGYLVSSLAKVMSYTAIGVAGVDQTPGGGDQTIIPGRQSANVGNVVYGVGIGPLDGGPALNYVVAWGGGSDLRKWDHGPRNCRGVAFFLNRLFVLANCDPDSTTPGNWAIYWSDPLDGVTSFLSTSVNAWKDDVSGLVNKIELPELNSNSAPVGLAIMGRALAVLGRKSIHVLRGTGPADWEIRKTISGIGCVDVRSVVSLEDSAYFASESGYYSYDGVTLDNVAKDIKAKFTGVGGTGSPTPDISAALLSHNYLLLTLANGTLKRWTGILNLQTGGWTSFAANANLLESGSVCYAASSDLAAVGTDGGRIWDLSGVPIETSGFTTYDVLTGTPDLKYNIPGQFVSRLLRLGEPVLKSQLARFTAGRRMYLQGGPDDVSTAWNFQWADPAGTFVNDFGVADVHTTHPYTRRDSVEVLNEVDELAVIATLTGPNGSSSVSAMLSAELHDCYLEYAVTRPGDSY